MLCILTFLNEWLVCYTDTNPQVFFQYFKARKVNHEGSLIYMFIIQIRNIYIDLRTKIH